MCKLKAKTPMELYSEGCEGFDKNKKQIEDLLEGKEKEKKKEILLNIKCESNSHLSRAATKFEWAMFFVTACMVGLSVFNLLFSGISLLNGDIGLIIVVSLPYVSVLAYAAHRISVSVRAQKNDIQYKQIIAICEMKEKELDKQ